MNKPSQPYENLADAITALRRHFKSEVLLASSIVHPRHAVPPEHLRLMTEESRGEPVAVPGLFACFLKAGVCFLSALFDALGLLLLQGRFAGSAKNSGAADVLIKSWVPGRAGLENRNDFYYGPLRDMLAKEDRRALFLVGDASSDDGRLWSKLNAGRKSYQFVAACLKHPEQGRYPEILLIPWWAPLALVGRQLVLSLRLRRFAQAASDRLLKRVAARAALDVLRPYTNKNFMFRWISRRAIQTWRPKGAITLFEGQPWEKLFWRGVKETDPSVKLAGYQHTVLLPHCLALLRPEKVEGDIAAPDLVLCTGEGTRARMEEGFRPFHSDFVVLGSHRRPVAATAAVAPRPSKKTVLVLPEGILREMVLLFDLAMELATLLPGHEFVFRCHPVLPYEKSAPFLKRKRENFSNIQLSNRAAIQEDFVNCSALLYRGSSAAIYSILDGVKPIYWAGEPGPNVDPLYLVPEWKAAAGSPEAFVNILGAFEKAPATEWLPAWERACGQVNAMVQPLTADSVGKFARYLL